MCMCSLFVTLRDFDGGGRDISHPPLKGPRSGIDRTVGLADKLTHASGRISLPPSTGGGGIESGRNNFRWNGTAPLNLSLLWKYPWGGLEKGVEKKIPRGLIVA
ncbi:hypothetical protein CDAR_486291 [Caerostris darwini]|uniref:Uncharacterized protein n=1 Tax=Caerostris darwini TaxID=1538125 RepID=A0AAV4M9Q3_9ARAC|nr:hypothetical protein CDAR_486291 [Caerostris darwini]